MPLPNFLIIGANKSGTTSLHEYLNQHPQVFMSPVKEPSYLALMGRDKESISGAERRAMQSVVTTFADYQALFDNAGECVAIGESSTAYLANPVCCDVIQHTLPDVKLLAILRHPIERAFSNYRMYRRWGQESRSFARAIRDELAGKSAHLPQGQNYLALGLYGAQLEPYLQTFGSDRVRVYFFERLQADATGLLKEICRYLGVDENFEFRTDIKFHADQESTPKIPKNFRFWSKGRFRHRDVMLLNQYYREDINRLSGLLGVSTASWLERY